MSTLFFLGLVVGFVAGRVAYKLWLTRWYWDEWRGSLDGATTTMVIQRLLWLPVWRSDGKWKSFRLDLHKMIAPDDDGCFHSHPAYAVRIVLRGGYVEEIVHENLFRLCHYRSRSLTTTRMRVEPGHIGLIRPEDVHRVASVPKGSSYSLWLRGPIVADVRLVGEGWEKQRRRRRENELGSGSIVG